MAKNKKKTKGAVQMDICVDGTTDCSPQAMDTSEGPTSRSSHLINANKKVKKSVPMKRAKNLKKRKSLERAVINSEKTEVKMSKNTNKKSRIQSAKTLYN